MPLGQTFPVTSPGGIDFNQLAFDRRERAIQAIIDPITQHELALFDRFHRIQPIGFFPIFGGFGETPMVIESPPPQVVVIEPPAPAAAAPSEVEREVVPQAAAPAETPLPELGQFLLVRRDGGVIDSVAFSVQGARVIYITEDGGRHAIAIDQIDLEATEERNAERGTILHLTQ